MLDIYVAAIVHMVYCIWLARNALRFSSVPISIHATIAKITSFVAMSGTHSNGNCLPIDVVLDNFWILPIYWRVKNIISVVWKPPSITWVKANTNGSVVNFNASCNGIFRGNFLGCFASNIGRVSIFEVELMDLIIAMEFTVSNYWNCPWLECDSSSDAHAFKNPLCYSYPSSEPMA